MFPGLGRWFGPQIPGTDGEDRAPQQVSRPAAQRGTGEQPQDPEPLHLAAGLGNYLCHLASAATRKITESFTETAQTIKKSMEEGTVEDIIDKTILGDFQKEQKKFVEEQHTKKCDAAAPPWVDSTDQEAIQRQILALAGDARSFLRDPPAGARFPFDLAQMHPVAVAMLREDALLAQMRFALVPKLVKEEVFWRNYFYRVALIKQAAQLAALAAQPQASGRADSGQAGAPSQPSGTPPVAVGSQRQTGEDEEEISTSPGLSEFVSDDFDACNLNQEDLRREMEQLVLDEKEEETAAPEEGSSDWEKELQQELQLYELVTEAETRDENWDKEIEKMLQQVN